MSNFFWNLLIGGDQNGQQGQNNFAHLARTLIVAGFFFVIFNALSHRLLDWIKFKNKRTRKVESELRPVVDAASDFVARIVELLFFDRVDYQRFFKDGDKTIPKPDPTEATPLQSTAFRLIQLLWNLHNFREETRYLKSFPMLDRADFFLQHKIPVAIKGNLYQTSGLSNELQEEIAVAINRLCSNVGQAAPTLGMICADTQTCVDTQSGTRTTQVGTKPPFPQMLWIPVISFLTVDVSQLREFVTQPDKNFHTEDPQWKKIFMLAHLAIYLIDFVQEFGQTSHWAEARIALCRLIRVWNEGKARSKYIYEQGDIESFNYLDTFPGYGFHRGTWWQLIRQKAFGWLGKWPERILKWFKLFQIGGRFRRRHEVRKVQGTGLTIQFREGPVHIAWPSDLRTVLRDAQNCLTRRRA